MASIERKNDLKNAFGCTAIFFAVWGAYSSLCQIFLGSVTDKEILGGIDDWINYAIAFVEAAMVFSAAFLFRSFVHKGRIPQEIGDSTLPKEEMEKYQTYRVAKAYHSELFGYFIPNFSYKSSSQAY